MAKKEPSAVTKSETSTPQSRSRPIAERGVTTGAQFAEVMSALMSDLICGAVTPDIGNAACNAGGKLLKIVEMQHKYGKVQANGDRSLKLVQPA